MLTRALLLAAALAMAPDAAAQSVMRAEPVPDAVAGDAAWFRAGEPVIHRGERYYPGGAQTFFDGEVMVLVGEFRGVPLYADPTLETGSIVYVPVSGRLMQPYERLRAGELAGTSGSRTPSYPPETASPIAAGDEPAGAAERAPSPPMPAMTTGTGEALPPALRVEPSARARAEVIAPEPGVRGRGIWIEWDGAAWSAAGPAVRIGPQFTAIGTFNGRTVYRGPGGVETIWIETAQGLATPWRR